VLAKIQQVTVRGILLKNQFIAWDRRTAKRRISVGKRKGQYELQEDGSLQFCLGFRSLQPHIVCRLHDAVPWLFRFNQAIGQRISVAGFLRSSFGNPGFRGTDDAHIFEICPIQSLEIGGELRSIELGVPISKVQDWTPELNDLDERRGTQYWKGSDTPVFSDIHIEEPNYVRLTGRVSDVTLNVSTDRPAWFILNSPAVARQLKITCLQGTRACRQLRHLRSGETSVIGVRSVDLGRALEDRYRINLLAVDLQP